MMKIISSSTVLKEMIQSGRWGERRRTDDGGIKEGQKEGQSIYIIYKSQVLRAGGMRTIS